MKSAEPNQTELVSRFGSISGKNTQKIHKTHLIQYNILEIYQKYTIQILFCTLNKHQRKRLKTVSYTANKPKYSDMIPFLCRQIQKWAQNSIIYRK